MVVMMMQMMQMRASSPILPLMVKRNHRHFEYSSAAGVAGFAPSLQMERVSPVSGRGWNFSIPSFGCERSFPKFLLRRNLGIPMGRSRRCPRSQKQFCFESSGQTSCSGFRFIRSFPFLCPSFEGSHLLTDAVDELISPAVLPASLNSRMPSRRSVYSRTS